ncbi:2-polyprenylphenol 6-hydroxylase [Amylibacter kogurei]|uniref:2-polyprenylphenol 6-hydroxylase n=1 Tax=Paramylibacter kogurei TaxID=1889778 RepID=A0A2G5K1X2_9RHOB|nr:2-polyprenylphenol 6-hydroxylase [Amylibacter kogurei]PIB23119.1 2-polyprenylphenol 6-hydroxylase [Amylibacter kogurei]
MRGPHNIWRLIRTGATFERTGAMKIVLEKLDVPPSVRIAARVLGWPFKPLGLRGDPSQPPMLRAITALGPAYIKFGQLMSTRPDVVGIEMADELKVLQDSLPPFAQSAAIAEIEHELGSKLGDIYTSFSEPIAAASIAQVHDAVLATSGQRVAVKVLRPDVERAFRRDIDAFYFGAGMVELLSPASRRLRPKAVIEHFDSVVEGELDLRMEASAAAEFSANTENDDGFHVPSVNWDQSGRTVMTLDWADGISVGNLPAMQASGVDLKEFGARIIQMFLRHALRDGFFHADMHQGNLKLAPNGDLIALDFGIMGRIDEYTRRVYAEILMGFIRKDYKRVAEVHFEAGYVPADQDVDAFAQALRSVGEPIFGQGAEQISMAKLLSHLFDVTERFGMETRTELILLQRTMVVVEGVARSLDPDLNIWTVARPEVENYIKDHLGPRAMAKDFAKTARVLSRFGPRLPEIVEDILMRNTQSDPKPVKPSKRSQLSLFLAGGASAVLAAWVLHQF